MFLQEKKGVYKESVQAGVLSPLFCLILGLGLLLLKPDSGLDESDCLSAILRTFLLEQRDRSNWGKPMKWLKQNPCSPSEGLIQDVLTTKCKVSDPVQNLYYNMCFLNSDFILFLCRGDSWCHFVVCEMLAAHLMGAPKMLSWLASVNTRETLHFNVCQMATTFLQYNVPVSKQQTQLG